MRTNVKGWLLGLGVAGIVQACGSGTDFAAVVSSAVGVSPGRPAIADFNGDGILDVVVGRGAAPFGIDIMIGKGDGTFTAGAASPLAQTGACSHAVAGDFNKDGKQDFAVGLATGKVSIYLGDGTGAFTATAASPIAFASSAVSVGRLLVADLNNDTKPDLVGVVPTGAQVAVALGDGAGAFGTAATYATGASTTPTDIALLQASSDAFLDIAVASSSTTTVPLFINKGDGTFNAAVAQALGTNSYGIAPGDINKDSKDDIVINDGIKNFTLLKGAKDSTLTAQTSVVNDNNPTTLRAMAVADLDHDGNQDVFMVDDQATGAAHASKGDGLGALASPTGYALGGANPKSIDLVDVNNDGAPDVVSVLSPAAPTAGQISVLINSHATKIALAADPLSPSLLGTSVKFTATLTQVFGSVPSGNVVFKDGATTLATVALASGAASYTTSALGQGAHSITVSYAGDTSCFPRDSSALAFNVRGDTTTALTSSVNPSVNGQQVVFTATVAGKAPATGIPSGTVTFTDGGVTVGTGTLDAAGVATFTTSSLTLATHAIMASYGGSTAFAPSASAPLSQTVGKADSAITLISSSNPSTKGASVTFTATASVKAPGTGTINGSLKFFDGAAQIGTSAISPATGVATLAVSNLASGNHTITATYDGTSLINGSVSNAVAQVVSLGTSMVAVTSSKNPSALGESVTFTAKVTSSGANPTGQVQFLDGATLLTTANLASAQASYQTSTLTGGTHSITAKYLGDANNASAMGTVSHVVSRLTTTATLVASKDSVGEGETVELTVTVAPSAASGTVSFKDGDVSIGTATLSSGTAKLTTTPLSLGAHGFVAVYEGDTTYDTATSAVVTVTAAAATTEDDAGTGTGTPTGGKDSGTGAGTGTGTESGDTSGEGGDGGGCTTSRIPSVPGGVAAAAFATFALAFVRRRSKK